MTKMTTETMTQTPPTPPKRTNANTSEAGDFMNRGSKGYISQIRSGIRYVTATRQIATSNTHSDTLLKHSKAELDSHADTTVAGSTYRVLEYTEKSCDIHPFSDDYEPMKQVPIAKVATAYDDPSTGETYILIFGQALYMGQSLDHTLICPNQARANGVVVDDVPRHLSYDGKSSHSIYFPSENVRIPLSLKGVISYILTRYPSQRKVNNCQWLIVTSDNDWEPYDESFQEKEDQLTPSVHLRVSDICTISTLKNHDLPTDIYQGCSIISTVSSSVRHLTVTDKMIASTFYCSPNIATKTRQVTTQRGLRSMTDHLCWRYRTKHDALRYNQLGGRHGRFYSDTLFASEKSLHGNTVAQIFANDIGYTYLMPMKSKSEAPYALKEFIQDVGIPSQLHTDDAKELTIGRWKEICQTHGIKQTQTEPHSQFQNRAEINIREVKKLSRRLMHSTNSPKRLWDLCAKHVAELRCLTAQPLYSLHGRTPFEMVTGNTPDISEYISFQWYQPVWFFDNTSFPEPTKHIARWIGVAHNIGQAMCFWVLPSSGIPIARSTVQSITEAELRDPSVQSRLQSYD